jgi:hypothetical protein
MEKETHGSDVTAGARGAEAGQQPWSDAQRRDKAGAASSPNVARHDAVAFLASRPVLPPALAPLPWYEGRGTAWLLMLPVVVGAGIALVKAVPWASTPRAAGGTPALRRAQGPAHPALPAGRQQAWVAVPQARSGGTRRHAVSERRPANGRHRLAAPAAPAPPRRERLRPPPALRREAPPRTAAAPSIHPPRGPVRRTAPRVIVLQPVPVRQTAPPPSPEESFRAAVERERIERQRSAEAFRLAEERERQERQRSEEQFRRLEQPARDARND